MTVELEDMLPVVLYCVLIIFVIALIVLVIKLIKTLGKVDKVLDDVNNKMVKVDGLFNMIDRVTDYASNVGDKIVSTITNAIHFVVRKRKKGNGKDE